MIMNNLILNDWADYAEDKNDHVTIEITSVF